MNIIEVRPGHKASYAPSFLYFEHTDYESIKKELKEKYSLITASSNDKDICMAYGTDPTKEFNRALIRDDSITLLYGPILIFGVEKNEKGEIVSIKEMDIDTSSDFINAFQNPHFLLKDGNETLIFEQHSFTEYYIICDFVEQEEDQSYGVTD